MLRIFYSVTKQKGIFITPGAWIHNTYLKNSLSLQKQNISYTATTITNPNDNTINKEETVLEEENVGSGWYSSKSIETRIRIARRRPVGAVGARGKPLLAEEDFYAAAGAPGYESIQTESSSSSSSLFAYPTILTTSTTTIPSTNTINNNNENEHEKETETTIHTPLPKTKLNKLSIPTPSYDLFSKNPQDFPLVRTSVASVGLGNLPSFIRTFQLKAIPFYKDQPGCISASLLIANVSAESSPGEICSTALMAKSSASSKVAVARREKKQNNTHVQEQDELNDSVSVTSITTWQDVSSLDTAISSPAYKEAMSALASYFQNIPTISMQRQVGYTNNFSS